MYLTSHTLISPLQLEDNSLGLQWCCGFGIKFYQGTRQHLYTIRHSWNIILTIYLDLAECASRKNSSLFAEETLPKSILKEQK